MGIQLEIKKALATWFIANADWYWWTGDADQMGKLVGFRYPDDPMTRHAVEGGLEQLGARSYVSELTQRKVYIFHRSDYQG